MEVLDLFVWLLEKISFLYHKLKHNEGHFLINTKENTEKKIVYRVDAHSIIKI